MLDFWIKVQVKIDKKSSKLVQNWHCLLKIKIKAQTAKNQEKSTRAAYN